MLIDYHNVSIQQEGLHILEDINLQIEPGTFNYLIGKVGTGKSSLLKTMYGELEIAGGSCAEVLGHNMMTIKSKQLPALRRQLGIVFQDFQILTDRTVSANLEFVLRATGWREKERIATRIAEVLEQVGMQSKGYKMWHEVSGGELQRIVIARALLNTPPLILADEPTGNLDETTGRQIVELLHHICSQGTTVVMTTHNLSLVREYPGRVFQCADHHVSDITEHFYHQSNAQQQTR